MRNECGPEQLWIPGLYLNDIYPEATSVDLVVAWDIYSQTESRPLEGVLGVYSPETALKAKAIASIDICEVLRETVCSLDIATGYEPRRRSTYASNDRWFHADQVDAETRESVILSTIQVLMNHEYVHPVSEIEELADVLRNWRENDIYCVANTATLPGCEIPTISKFFSTYAPECFDAIVFPRNHDGKGPITKAKALDILAQEAGISHEDIPIVHIDDAPHHVDSFAERFNRHQAAAYFVPGHSDNSHVAGHLRYETSLAAFREADNFFAKHGVIK